MSNQLDLFPRNVGAALSPLAQWKARYKVRTYFSPDRKPARAWEAWIHGDPITRYGETETDALFALTKLYRIPLWNESPSPKPGSR